MVTKGIIKTIDFTSNTCTVRLPLFETAGNVTEMTIPATFSITPGIYNSYKEGDVVEVAFDNGELQNPVVVGKLYLGTNKESQEYRGSANFSDLTVKNSVTLPIDTKFSVDPGNNTIEKVKGGNNSIKSVNDIIYNIQDLNKKIVDQEIQNDGLYLTKNNSGQTSGFGWSLNADSWKLTSYQPNQSPLDIFVANKNGVTIQGDLTLVGQPSSAKDVYAMVEAKNYLPDEDGKYNADYVFSDNTRISAISPSYATLDDINNNWYTKEKIEELANSGEDQKWANGWNDDLNQPNTLDGYYLWKLTYILVKELDSENEPITNISSTSIYLLDKGNTNGPSYTLDGNIATDAYQLAQGKSTNYYSSSDPTSEQGGSYSVKEGDCWFDTSEGNKTLKQWTNGNWVDIGGELVANKVTANYINAMDITAKKIEVLDSNNNDIIFLADGTATNDSDKVKIGGFSVDNEKIYNGNNLGNEGTVAIGNNLSITDLSNLATNFNIDTENFKFHLLAGENFGVTSDGILYTKSAVINDATINSKIEVKDGNNILFLADASNDPNSQTKGQVQIGDFSVNADNKKLYINQDTINTKVSTELGAGNLVIQSKSSSAIINSYTCVNDYYVGASTTPRNAFGSGIAIGLFGNQITRIYPKKYSTSSDELWNFGNLTDPGNIIDFQVPGWAILDTFKEKTQIAFSDCSVDNQKSLGFHTDGLSTYAGCDMNMCLNINLELRWKNSESCTWKFDIRKLDLFRTNFGPEDSWSPSATPVIMGGQISAIDGRKNDMSIYIPNLLTSKTSYISWDNWELDNLESGQIGIIARNEDAKNPADFSLNDGFYRRYACLTLYLYYPPFGKIN